ncbi:lactonase family protein [Vibrio splendidus]|uniref:Lactonase family protein n=1 Tax=Vibrio splendidus TaxID=29497 RepID=A0ABD5AF98_VIBSP|nr:lactonase family protein [Vibrio splendidus]MBU2910309.1 lactonase family protein [Vibrio splendidus]MDO6531970.1 lactonase family protein [Vibrio splendidus]MDO6553129.1 lactonase family protein [Vibrio splendidus]MDP2491916.1 lactonase family protein [Vibrio splendidus]PMO52602.1 3-carboxymuconate cyclase [Vibrio splendidus]
MKTLPLTIGCYTDTPSKSQGVYQTQLDLETGKLLPLELIAECHNPSFITATKSGIYTASEVEQKKLPKLIHIPNVDSQIASNTGLISGDHPCHVAIDPHNKFAITSQYSSGTFDIFSLSINGNIDKRLKTIKMVGSGPNKERQTSPHAHQCLFLQNSPQFVTVDLGTDRINFYCFDEEQEEFLDEPMQSIKAPAGNGTRHLIFNKAEDKAYVIGELSETILILEKSLGIWNIVDEVDALPNMEKGEAAAAIKLSPDEQFLYVSCRHQSRISSFSVDSEAQKLTFIDSYDTEGKFPRDFHITDNGQWLVAANQHSNNITSFKRSIEDGSLTYTGYSLDLDAPVCVTQQQ